MPVIELFFFLSLFSETDEFPQCEKENCQSEGDKAGEEF